MTKMSETPIPMLIDALQKKEFSFKQELLGKYKYLLETQQKRYNFFKEKGKYKGKANAKGKIEMLELIIKDLECVN